MSDTSRRVNVTLTAAIDEPAHQVMAGVLDAVRNALPGLAIESTSTHAYDLAEDEESVPHVQLVFKYNALNASFVDSPGRADEYARRFGGVVVELPVVADYRPEESR